MRVQLNGRGGKVGTVLAPALEGAGHSLAASLAEADVLVDFTRPDAVVANVLAAIEAGLPAIVGTSGWDPADVDTAARAAGVPVFFAPNFAVGAVLMMRFAAEAAKHMAKAEIIELHHDQKLDAPSGTAARTAELMAAATGGEPPGGIPIHSVRLPGLVANQEVIFGDIGQTLAIRHDTIGRESFMPGVLLAIRRVGSLEQSPVIGLEHLLF